MNDLQLTAHERKLLRHLSTPVKIQNFLDTLPINFELRGETCMSPRRVMRERTAHCMEGALLAALALRVHGQPPLIMDLRCSDEDDDHVVALFRKNRRWGALSKTNHAVLRYREPIYRDIRELALSYFHEYFTDHGKKILRSYSIPLNLSRFDRPGAENWIIAEKDVFYIPEYLDDIRHYEIAPRTTRTRFRRAAPIEIAAGSLFEWGKRGKRLFKVSKKR